MSEPYNGMHDDEFFDWYIQVSNAIEEGVSEGVICLLYTSPSPRDH